jgi:hypothetical protein
VAAAEVVAMSIRRAVRAATGLGGVLSVSESVKAPEGEGGR